MRSIRLVMTAASLVAVLAVSAGCATPTGEIGAESEGASSSGPRTTPPTDTEIAVACGLDIVRELAPEGYHPTRADALTALIKDYRNLGAETIQESTHLPYALYVELLEAALKQLPEHERGLEPTASLRMEVVSGGSALGAVEISPNFHNRYGLTMLAFAAHDPALCEEFYAGDFGT